jgi:hypothetical protein
MNYGQVFAWINDLSPDTGKAILELFDEFEALRADGSLSFNDIRAIVLGTQQTLMKLLGKLKVDGALKKEAVLVIVGKLYDSIPVVPLPGYLRWLDWIPGLRGWLRARLRAELLDLVDYTVETVYQHWLAPPELNVFPPVQPAA